MKKLLLAGLVLTAVSCATDDDLKYQKVRTEVQVPSVHNEPSGGQLQYMAYCNAEERALSGWVDSRSEAESAASSYRSEHPGRDCSILWRQKPGTQKLIPKYPKG
ncbi:MAG TPA: hypothetical protein VNM14_26620 [Planctomycetota bacterium]|jgi:hypothetical protein|nr:hypothetical protein [Planctomycetota bacterium]